MLLAPWWWRATRTAAAAGAALLVVVVAEVGLLSEIDDTTLAVLLTVLGSVGVTAYATWRQTRWAREIAGPAGEHARPQSVLTRKLRLTGVLLLVVALLTVFLQAAANTATDDTACRIYLPPDPHFPQVAAGHSASNGCPLHPVAHAGDISWIQQADGTYAYWFPSVGGVVTMTAAMVARWLEYRSVLGDPVDTDRHDGGSRYLNFANGYLLEDPDQPVVVATGRYRPTFGRTSCLTPDRPCLTDVRQTAGGAIELDWKYPSSDAYNVRIWVEGRPGIVSYEAAHTHFVLDGPEPGVTYGFQVQACRKQFLARSRCTPESNAVSVRTLG